MPEKPPQPPEGRLLEEALTAARPELTQREAARRAGISDARWRQLVTGYQSVGAGHYAPVIARAETLARMAAAVGVTPEQLVEVDRKDAASALLKLQKQLPAVLPVGAGVDPEHLVVTREELAEAIELAVSSIMQKRAQRGEQHEGGVG